MDSSRPRTQTSAKITKLATGVALTSCRTGSSSSSTVRDSRAAAASATLHRHPSANPPRMRPLENATLPQKSAVGSSRTRVSSARRGDTRNTSCPTATAAHCHSASQKAAAASRAGRDFLDVFNAQPPFLKAV